MKLFKALVILLSFSTPCLSQDEMSGKVISVLDGNTIEVATGSESYKIAFAGIDCPELEQEYGDRARKYLERLLKNKEVEFQIQGKDRWGNYVAVVMLDDTDPRIELLKEGLAWTSEKNPHPELENHRIEAEEKSIGLWKEENPTPPWIFRRQKSMLQPKSS